MINNAILNTDDLLATTGFAREGDLRRSLEEQGVPYFVGKGGRPWTTIGLIESAKGVGTAADQPAMFGANIL